MPDQAGIHAAVELWHLLLAVIPLAAGFIVIDRHFWKPVRDWRSEVEKWRVAVDKDLERGKTKMDTIEGDLKCLDGKMDRVLERLTAIETLMRAQGGLSQEV